ncbi:hypothetical protein ACFOWM_02825 [Ferruginibacter yonginensis]|uniref:Secreted protein n=1 Tax=Ferruginibacter yonginensis TaxID=1310416 RepID=A0ABV8QNE2_9BACT
MKKTMILLLFVALCGVTTVKAQSNIGSQSYKTALGVKFYPGAVSLKHFVDNKNAVEFLGYFWNRGTRITGLYEIHGNFADAGGLRWYIGPGAHVAFYNDRFYRGRSYVGVDGVVGLDYKIKSAPINLSLDWQPSFEFGDGAGFSGNWGGLAIRYVF